MVKRNVLYNIIYQMLVLIVPLITAPYLSRVIGADGIGEYTYTYSVVCFFMMFTLMGVNNYGNRAISRVRNNREQSSTVFTEILCFQLFMGFLMMLSYYSFVFLFLKEYKTIACLQGVFIISAMLDINWLYFGLEEFKITITRNALVKVGSLILVFLLVKRPEDLWIYTLIMSSATALSQIMLWLVLRRFIDIKRVTFSGIKRHISGNIILFIPVVAISLYKIMDKIMLGLLSDMPNVAYYENAEKIVLMPTTLMTAFSNVMLPRVSYLVSVGDNKKSLEYTYKTIKYVFFLIFPITFGLVSIAPTFAPLFFGDEFTTTGQLIQLLSLCLPIIALASIIRTQFLIPREKDRVYVVSVIVGALVNMIINLILIPIFKSIGACLGTITAEITVFVIQYYASRKEISIIKALIDSKWIIISSAIMFLAIMPVKTVCNSMVEIVMVKIIIGFFLYLLLNGRLILHIIKDITSEKNEYQ